MAALKAVEELKGEIDIRLKRFEKNVIELENLNVECDRNSFFKDITEQVSGIHQAVRFWAEEKLHVMADELTSIEGQPSKKKFIAIEDFERKQALLKTKRALHKELQEQRDEYVKKMEELRGALEMMKKSKKATINPFACRIWLIGRSILVESKRLVQGLPIYANRSKIVEMVRSNQYIVLKGETGSGKSTQVPQYVLESITRSSSHRIICTQPRKVAAISLAQRIAAEQCEKVGKNIGYWVGMNKNYGPETKLLLMTDRMLLNHCLENPNLDGISCVIIDEAHERSVNIDMVLGLVKSAAKKRADLKILVTSATISTTLFSGYFYNCPVIEIPGRTFPIAVEYEEPKDESEGDLYLQHAINKALQLHQDDVQGDMLVFVTSPIEVEKAVEQFKSKSKRMKACTVLPLHGKLQPSDQLKVFETSVNGQRKIVFSTNVAETSITIPGIKIVIDSGRVKERMYDPQRGIGYLEVRMVSKSSAIQRMGRAGRTGPGTCIRLYSNEIYHNLSDNNEPEIKKMHLGSAVLNLMALGISDVKNFDFIEPPHEEAVASSIATLRLLGAINENGTITTAGKQMAKIPLNPRGAKVVLCGCEADCRDEAVSLAAVMTYSASIYIRIGSDEDKRLADEAKLNFCSEDGDLLSIYDIFQGWKAVSGKKEQNRWCVTNCINAKSMRSIKELADEIDHAINFDLSCSLQVKSSQPEDRRSFLKQLIALAFSDNIAFFTGHSRIGYWSPKYDKRFLVHPSSVAGALAMEADYLIFQDVIKTSTDYITSVTPIDRDLIRLIGLRFYHPTLSHHKVETLSISPLGSAVLRTLIGNRGETRQDLERAITDNGKYAGLLEISLERREVVILASRKKRMMAEKLVKDCIEKEQRRLQMESKEMKLDGRTTGHRVLIGSGGEAVEILQPDEFVAIRIEMEKCLVEINDHFFADVSLVIKEKIDRMESVRRIDAQKVEDFSAGNCLQWGIVRFATSAAAKVALKEFPFDLHGYQVKGKPLMKQAGQNDNDSLVKVSVTWSLRNSRGFGFIKCDSFDDAVQVKQKIRFPCKFDRQDRKMLFVSPIDRNLNNEAFKKAIYEQVQNKDLVMDAWVVYEKGSNIIASGSTEAQEAQLKRILNDVTFSSIYMFPVKKEDTVIARANVFFVDFEEAEKAVHLLDGNDTIGTQTCHAAVQMNSKFFCNKATFAVIKDYLKEVEDEARGFKIKIAITNNKSDSGKLVHVSGESSFAYKAFLGRLRDVLEGEKIEGITFPILSYESMKTKISSLEQKIGKVKVVYDRRTKFFILYGRPESRLMLKNDLIELCKSMPFNETKIYLRGNGRPQGLMKALMQQYGGNLQAMLPSSDAGTIQLNMRQHVATVTASKSVQQDVKSLVDQIDNELRNKKGFLTKQIPEKSCCETECNICLCEAESQQYALQLCGHIYCVSCLNDFLDSCEKEKDFPVRCCKDDCLQTFVIEDFNRLVKNMEQLERLAAAAVSHLVMKCPKLYKYCPTPDCSMVYKVSTEEDAKSFVCPKCFKRTCTACHGDSHAGFSSCASWKRYNDDTSVLQWAANQDVIQCPKCENLIEKNGGCMHIACKCGAYICWRCMESFHSSKECYDHLSSCGGIFPGRGERNPARLRVRGVTEPAAEPPGRGATAPLARLRERPAAVPVAPYAARLRERDAAAGLQPPFRVRAAAEPAPRLRERDAARFEPPLRVRAAAEPAPRLGERDAARLEPPFRVRAAAEPAARFRERPAAVPEFHYWARDAAEPAATERRKCNIL